MRRRLLLARRRRAARRGEARILEYTFPAQISRRVRRRTPEIDEANWELVERGLREWFVCCAWRGRTVLGMPSRAVDEAWHEFILDSLAYTLFCDLAFGEYLHHTPDEAMSTPMGDALGDTVRAWDRSGIGAGEESVLWDLDARLGIDEPLEVDELSLTAARERSPYPLASGWACAAGVAAYGAANAGGYSGQAGVTPSGCGVGGGGDGGGCGGGGGCGSGCGGGS
jgi:hypothetical protein